MPSIKELKDELKRLGISKGLSKMTKTQLDNLIQKAKEPHKVNTLQERKALLSTISKKDLLKVIKIIRISNYSHLKHDELIDLIASKYYSDFHTRWFNQAPDELLPNKPAKPLPKPSFSFPPEPKKKEEKTSKKESKKPKKSEVKEEEKYVDEWNLENAKSTIDKLHLLPTIKAKEYMKFLLNRFQGNLKFYKQNKTIIDKFTTPTQRKRLSFLPNIFI